MEIANLLRLYNAALHEKRTPMTLHNASDRFLREHGFVDETGVIREPPWTTVLLAHRARVHGEGSPALCDEALQKAIREITNV